MLYKVIWRIFRLDSASCGIRQENAFLEEYLHSKTKYRGTIRWSGILCVSVQVLYTHGAYEWCFCTYIIAAHKIPITKKRISKLSHFPGFTIVMGPSTWEWPLTTLHISLVLKLASDWMVLGPFLLPPLSWYYQSCRVIACPRRRDTILILTWKGR